MSAFKDDHAENLKNVEYAYEYGRSERELEIIKLLENLADITTNYQHKLGVLEAVACIKFNANHAALIKGENNG